MKPNQKWAVAVAAGICVAVIGISCSTLAPRVVVEPLEVPGAHYVGNQVCYDCHTNIVRKFQASAHARLYLADTTLQSGAGCESCHGPGSRHVEAGGGRGKFIINPVNEPQACFRCHAQTRAEFQLPAHHPVFEGHMNCAQCHDPHSGDVFQPSGSGLAMARQNESCAQCHREQMRPFVFEHPAIREGCTTCHSPHGSINRAMLRQPDSNLCLRCHAQTQGLNGQIFIGQTQHNFYMQMGGCWTVGCHTAIHGSDVDPRLRY